MTTLPNMGLVLPVRGDLGAGIWDDTLDADLEDIDAHDHSTGKGALVPTAGMNINADLTFSSLWAPINLHRLTFASITALSTSNKSVFVNAADNELYWRSNAGVNVKLTAGSALNVAAFTGGIGGDYVAVGAAVAFDDAADRYTFRQQSSLWARLHSGDVRLSETGTTETAFVGLAAPAALGGSYTLTMPASLPGSTSLLQLTSAGQVSASNEIINTTIFNSTVECDAGLTMAVNQTIITSGTGDFKHGARDVTLGGSAFQAGNNFSTASISYDSSSNHWTMGVAPNDNLGASVPLRSGDRIISLNWLFDKGGSASIMTLALKTRNGNTITTRDTVNDSTSGVGFVFLARAAINYTIAGGDAVWLSVSSSNAAHRFAQCVISFDHP
jgi:hypothetical protein